MIEFIYQPCSGDRVFASREARGISVIDWPNGCRHVIGGQRLSYSTARPGGWWRLTAKRAAADLVRLFGGIAWDDQGEVSLIIPRRFAARAALVMQGIGGASVEHRDRLYIVSGTHIREPGRNEAALFASGLLDMHIDERSNIYFSPRWLAPDKLPEPLRIKLEEQGEKTILHVSDDSGTLEAVSAPKGWGAPQSLSLKEEPSSGEDAKTYRAIAFCVEKDCNCEDAGGILLYLGPDLEAAQGAIKLAPEGYEFIIYEGESSKTGIETSSNFPSTT